MPETLEKIREGGKDVACKSCYLGANSSQHTLLQFMGLSNTSEPLRFCSERHR